MGIPHGGRIRAAALAAIAVVALGLSACTGGNGPTAVEAANTVSGDVASGIEGAVAEAMELSGSTTAIVGVWQGDDAAYVQAFGDGVTVNSPIRAGQASQPVVCAALLELVNEGALTLDRKIAEDMPRQLGIEDISYSQLCTATSGLGDFKPGLGDIFVNNPTRPWVDRELLSHGLSRSPLSWPGLDVHLSDTNSLLLARSLRMATREPVNALLAEHVFAKAEMTSSFYPAAPGTDVTLPSGGMTGFTQPLSRGTFVCDVEPVEVTAVAPAMLAGAGATVTTVTDLKNFYRHYLGDTFGEGTGELITQVQSTVNPKRDEQGNPLPPEEGDQPAAGREWGFGLEKVGPLFGMSGSMTGTITAAYHDPSSDVTVVVALNNSTAGATFARTLALQLASIGGVETSWSVEDQANALAAAAPCPAAE